MTTESELTLISYCSSPELDISKCSTDDSNDLSRISDYSDLFSKHSSILDDSEDVFSDISQSPISQPPISLINLTKHSLNIPVTSQDYLQSRPSPSLGSSSSASCSLSDNNFEVSEVIDSLDSGRSSPCSPAEILSRDDNHIFSSFVPDNRSVNSSMETVVTQSTGSVRCNRPQVFSYCSRETLTNQPLLCNRRVSSLGDMRNHPRLSYVARALALARPTSPPPPYKSGSIPTVLALRSYFGFRQVGNRPHSAPNHTASSSGPNYDPNDMTNEPYTLQATHMIQLVPISNAEHTNGRPQAHTPTTYTRTATPNTRAPTPDSRANTPANVGTTPESIVSNTSVVLTNSIERLSESGDPRDDDQIPNYRQHREIPSNLLRTSTVITPLLILETNSDVLPPPPYTAGNWPEIFRAPRYSEVVNPHFIRNNAMFGRNSALSCMGSIRTLAIGITLCCCGVVFLMVTYVFGAVTNIYLGYLGVLQVFIGITMIFLVAVYNSGRCDLANIVKRTRNCLSADHP